MSRCNCSAIARLCDSATHAVDGWEMWSQALQRAVSLRYELQGKWTLDETQAVCAIIAGDSERAAEFLCNQFFMMVAQEEKKEKEEKEKK